MGRGRIASVVLAASVAAVLLLASTAQAAFHLIKVREVYSGTADDSYVVLQMYVAGERFVAGHSVTLYDSTGALSHTSTFSTAVPNGANQQTILVGDTGTQTTFGVAPDLVDASLAIPAAGGAVCWNAGGFPADCVAWGSFSGGASFESAVNTSAGTPVSATGITPGKAIRRTIAPGCATLLEAGDDSDDSATDFSEQTPNPRNNASAIVEAPCVAPNTTITGGSVANGGRTKETTASFSFSATPSEGASFECKLDTGEYEACTSPQEYSGLDGSKTAAGTLHTFEVRAENADGKDPTPAARSWTVDTVAPTMTITAQPEDPSSGASAPFSYVPNESVTGTQCRLDTPGGEGSFESCPSGGKTYTSLEDGLHTFMVRATDLAGNQSAPGEFPAGTYSWTVDNSLADTTPPQTTIVLKPPNPSGSSTALFTYASNEPGSTFECRLDGAPFEACSPLGKTYSGLANGTHTFEVRARDESGNLDPTPDGYTFDVVLAIAPPPPPPPPTEPEPGTAFAAGVAPVKGAFALLRMGCRGQEGARCEGSMRLLAQVGGAHSSRAATRNLVVGQGRYDLPAGSRGRVVRARLTSKGRRLVRRAGRRGLPVRLVGKRLKKRSLTLRGTAKKRRPR